MIASEVEKEADGGADGRTDGRTDGGANDNDIDHMKLDTLLSPPAVSWQTRRDRNFVLQE